MLTVSTCIGWSEDISAAGPKEPMKFYVPHMPVSFGPGGQLVCVSPSSPSDGQTALVELHSMEVNKILCPLNVSTLLPASLAWALASPGIECSWRGLSHVPCGLVCVCVCVCVWRNVWGSSLKEVMLDWCFTCDTVGSYPATRELIFVFLLSPWGIEPHPRTSSGFWYWTHLRSGALGAHNLEDQTWVFCSRLFWMILRNKKRWGLSQDHWSGKSP